MESQSTTPAKQQTKQHKPPAKNRMLIKFREWHIWLGIGLSLFIVIICVTGVYLNHDKFFKGKRAKTKPEGSGTLTTTTDLTAQPISFAQALARARAAWGDIPIKHVHLNDEGGTLVYKIKAHAQDREILVNASTGALLEKNGYQHNTQAHSGAAMKSGINWGKVMKDLHTGQLGGEGGKLLVDFTSVIIIGLTLTGIYLWGVPKWRKRQATQKAAAQTEAKSGGRLAVG
jgi:hypothetical protein